MEISHPNSQEPTPEELLDLEKLKVVIEQAIADGRLTQDEVSRIKTAAWADGKITVQELNLVRELVVQKMREGEIEWVW